MTSANAVDREAAWLTTAGDGLPALKTSAGGPFDVIQAYIPRSPALRKKGLYVTRGQLADQRFSQQRRMATHSLRLVIQWPISSGAGSAETEQRALDAAIDLVLQRIVGPVMDKTHGGRFLAVAEAPNHGPIQVIQPPLSLIGLQGSDASLTTEIHYEADDPDYTG